MKRDLQRIFLAAVIPLFFLFILYMLKILEVGMGWDFTHLGIYPQEKQGIFGIFAHPLVHSSFKPSCRGVFFTFIGTLPPIYFS